LEDAAKLKNQAALKARLVLFMYGKGSGRIIREFRRAVGAARRLDVDLAAAIRTGLGGGSGRGFFAASEALQLVDSLDDQKDDKRHDQKVDDGRDEGTVLNGGPVDVEYIRVKIRTAEEADDGGDDVLGQ